MPAWGCVLDIYLPLKIFITIEDEKEICQIVIIKIKCFIKNSLKRLKCKFRSNISGSAAPEKILATLMIAGYLECSFLPSQMSLALVSQTLYCFLSMTFSL